MAVPDTTDWSEEKMERLAKRCEERNVHIWSFPDVATYAAVAKHRSVCVVCGIRPATAQDRNNRGEVEIKYRHRCVYRREDKRTLRCVKEGCPGWRLNTKAFVVGHSTRDVLLADDDEAQEELEGEVVEFPY